MTYGATPAEWHHFADTLGLREDLLPIVCDPSAKPQPPTEHHKGSSVKEPGKLPSRFKSNGFFTGFAAWPEHVADEKDIARWSNEPRYGFGINTRLVRAIDIDIDDPVKAAEIRSVVHAIVPGAPVRFRAGSGKCLLPVIVRGKFSKRSFAIGKERVELLATGQQFVCCGVHPKGMRYEWSNAHGVLGLPESIPEIDIATLDYLWDALLDEFGDAGTEARGGEAVTLLKPRVLSDANDPVVPWLYEKGLVVGETSKGLEVKCPNAGQHSSDTGVAMYFPAGVGGRDEQGFKCLHDHCSHIRGRVFLQLIGYEAEKTLAEFDVVVQADGEGAALRPARMDVDHRTGRIKASLAAVVAALQTPEWSGVSVIRDRFDQRDRVRYAHVPLPQAWVPGWLDGFQAIEDSDYGAITLTLVDAGFEEAAPHRIVTGVGVALRQGSVDSAQSWLASLVWDGVPRVVRFFEDYWRCGDPPEYLAAVSEYVWCAMAGRVLSPGLVADMMPVVEGKQKCGKSRGCAAMAPDKSMVAKMDFSERMLSDFVLYANGKLMLEFAEMTGLSNAAVERVKAFMDHGVDTYRLRHDKRPRDYPRRALMIGTTNDAQYLRDQTGSRRFLPMTVPDGLKVNVDRIAADSLQLWAEGAVMFRDGGYIRRCAAAEDASEKFAVHESRQVVEQGLMETVSDILARPVTDFDSAGVTDTFGSSKFRMSDLMRLLAVSPERQTRALEMRLGAVLKALGYRNVTLRVDGVKAKRWMKQ